MAGWRRGMERPRNILTYKRLRRLPLPAKSPFLMAGWRAGHPLRQLVAGNSRCSLFPEEFDPFRQFQLAGGGGRRMHEMLDDRALVAFRQLHDLAEWGYGLLTTDY